MSSQEDVPQETAAVTGVVVLPSGAVPSRAAQVVVQVEDVSRADAPSTVITEQRLSGVALTPDSRIPFAVPVPPEKVEPGRRYSVRVHVDVSGSGDVEVGDLVSTQSHPVLTDGAGGEVQVPVQRV